MKARTYVRRYVRGFVGIFEGVVVSGDFAIPGGASDTNHLHYVQIGPHSKHRVLRLELLTPHNR
jgi:hypothetical protein